MIEFNIAPNTQIGRIDILEKIYEDENAYGQDKYSRSGEFIDNMVVDNHVEFCHRWLGLASVEEFLDDMMEYSEKLKYGAKYSNRQSPIYSTNESYCPIEIYDQPKRTEVPLYFYGTLEDHNMSTKFDDYKKE